MNSVRGGSHPHDKGEGTTIVTLAMDAGNEARFSDLRQAHYPAHLNRIAAHLTLFHSLPATDAVRAVLQREAKAMQTFTMQVSGVMGLGRGVAYGLHSQELNSVHERLRTMFAEHLTPQDRHGFRPHVVVQNKVSGEAAKLLREQLSAAFVPWDVRAEGLDWWDYLGGPWELRERFRFG